jgi:regulator of protease activity HflC (stomatin/prohibitin superfamily)
VEIKSIDPPGTIQEAMEKQMRAERDRRAAILTAEGIKQSQILKAEGEKQAAVLTAEGDKQSAILRAEGEAQAIATVFGAIHKGKPDPELLSYQYLQMLPQLAKGDANKVFVIPSEFAEAFGGITRAFAGGASPGRDEATAVDRAGSPEQLPAGDAVATEGESPAPEPVANSRASGMNSAPGS